MIHEFTLENIDSIGAVLNATPKRINDVIRIELTGENGNRKLALEIHLGLIVDGTKMNMVSVYAQNTFIQIHNCTGFVASDLLNQVTFFGKDGSRTTGLIVEREAGCSIYANVSDDLLSGDFTKLPTEVMMSSVALSLTENIDFEGFSFEDEP